MIGALWNGITGLNSFEKALNVESNNATNVDTIGYKEDIVSFQDMMYKNESSSFYGKGTSIASVGKAMYQQGGLKITNNPYDVAIEGKGYFIVNNVNAKGQIETFYTRAGDFKLGEDGLLKTQNNMNVMGISSVKTQDGTNSDFEFDNSYVNYISTQAIGSLDNIITINSRATDYNNTATSDDISQSGTDYKTKSSKLNDIDILIQDYKNRLKEYSLNPNATPSPSVAQVTYIDFSSYLSSLQTENDYLKVTIDGNEFMQTYDPELGLDGTLKAFSDKISNTQGFASSIDTATGILNITSLIPGKEVKINDAYINNQNLDPQIVTQAAQLGSGIDMVNSSRDALKSAIQRAGADLLEITNTVSLDNEKNNTLNNLSTIQLNLSNLNISTGAFGDLEINDGIVFLSDGNNKFIVGKLQTAAFLNEQGLIPQGGNVYKASDETGPISNGINMNKLVSTSLEQSKANMSNTLTALLIYQKAFTANSKSITTSDEILQTAIQLKK